MLELAWFWIRYQPDSPLTIWFRERVGTAKAHIRRIAIIAGLIMDRHDWPPVVAGNSTS
jgi:hypothetical protein